jgi:hypothetical protein
MLDPGRPGFRKTNHTNRRQFGGLAVSTLLAPTLAGCGQLESLTDLNFDFDVTVPSGGTVVVDVTATNTGDDAFDGVLEVQVTVSGSDGVSTFRKTSGVRIPGGESKTYTTEFSAPGATSRSDVTSVNVEFSTST